MASTLRLLIVTPEGTTFSEDVNIVTLPCVQGQIGIYPLHVPLITQMIPGEIIVEQDGRERFLAVGGGIVDVTAEQVAILTDMAVAAESIDDARAEEAKREAGDYVD
jgi:F-type H+-transporting ATPase subunit epsilon